MVEGPLNGGDAGTPQPPKRRSRGRARRAGVPLGQSPWGESAWTPHDADAAITEAIGPAVIALKEFEHALIDAIMKGMNAAFDALQHLDNGLQTDMYMSRMPASQALARLDGDLANAIRLGLGQSAEFASAALGEPVTLADVGTYMDMSGSPPGQPGRPVGVPGHPDYPSVPLLPTGPIPDQPHPPTRPIVIPPPTTPFHPLPSQPVRGPVPEGPPVPGYRPWDSAATTGPVASGVGASAPAPSDGTGQAWGLSVEGAPTGPCDPPVTVLNPDGSGYTCSNVSLTTWTPVLPTWQGPNPDPEHCLINYNGQLVCHYAFPLSGTEPVSPTPTPSPPPTPPPVKPPSTPGSCQPAPIIVQCPPAAPPPPTPPAPPSPPPPPPGPPKPPPPDRPPPPICPPGYTPIWNGSSWECQPRYPIPITPIPEPTPTPEPTQPVTVTVPAPKCDGTRDDPCWRAANEMNEKDTPFHITSGLARVFADGKADAVKPRQEDIPDAVFDAALVDNADDPTRCDQAFQMQMLTQGFRLIDILPAINDIGNIAKISLDNKSLTNKVANWTIVAPLVMTIQFLFNLLSKLISSITDRFGDMELRLGAQAFRRSVLGFLNTLCFGGLDRIKRIFDYQCNFEYQTQVPSPELAAAGWLGAEIDDCAFQAYVMGGDERWLPYLACTRASKMKFTPIEIYTLYKRHGLARSNLDRRLREVGSLHPEDREELDALYRQIPGPADLVRFMQRDVDNREVVGKFRMDDGFTENYTSKTKEWAEEQGLDEDSMRRYWRAHWTIPSPTQLREFWHRLRHSDDFGGAGDVESAVRTALKQQDILPYWIDWFMATSFLPLNHTTLLRAYEKGWIDDDRFQRGMYDIGYSDDDAQTLLSLAKRERDLTIMHSDFVNAYADGYMDQDTMLLWAEKEGYEQSLVDTILDHAEFRRTIAVRRRAIEAIARQFKSCRISEAEARQDAAALGVPESVVDTALGIAELNTTCGSKREMQSALCNALDEGIITPEQYVDRMRKLKYDDDAIQTLLGLCVNKIAARRAAAIAKARKEAEAEARREEAAKDKADRKRQAAVDKLARARSAEQRREEERNSKLEAAANKLGQTLTDVSGPPSEFVIGLFHLLMDDNPISQNEAANIIHVTASASKGMDMAEYAAWTREVALTALRDPWSLLPAGAAGSNGHA
jgi:hypothetical protein